MTSPQSLTFAPARLVSVLRHFPPVTYAFAYGSGAHHQPGLYESSETQEEASIEPHSDGLRRDAGGEASTTQFSVNDTQSKDTFSSTSSTVALSGSRGRGGPVIDYIFAVKDAHVWHTQVGWASNWSLSLAIQLRACCSVPWTLPPYGSATSYSLLKDHHKTHSHMEVT
jgi:hypothetical protein